jgi:hypothetical protein
LGTVGGLLGNVLNVLAGPQNNAPTPLLTGLSETLLFGQGGVLGAILDGALVGSDGGLGLGELLGTGGNSSLLDGLVGNSTGLFGGSNAQTQVSPATGSASGSVNLADPTSLLGGLLSGLLGSL